MVLRVVPSRGKHAKADVVSALQRRLRLFLLSDIQTLWTEALQENPTALGGVQTRAQKKARPAPKGPLSAAQLDRVRQLLSEGAAKKSPATPELGRDP